MTKKQTILLFEEKKVRTVWVFGVWLIIALAKGADWFGGSGKDYKESDRDFLNRVARENSERARKKLEEIRKSKRES